MTFLRSNVPSFANLTVVCRKRRSFRMLLKPHSIHGRTMTGESCLSKTRIIRILMTVFPRFKEREKPLKHEQAFPSTADRQIEFNVPLQRSLPIKFTFES